MPWQLPLAKSWKAAPTRQVESRDPKSNRVANLRPRRILRSGEGRVRVELFLDVKSVRLLAPPLGPERSKVQANEKTELTGPRAVAPLPDRENAVDDGQPTGGEGLARGFVFSLTIFRGPLSRVSSPIIGFRRSQLSKVVRD